MAKFALVGNGRWGQRVAAKILVLGHEYEACSARTGDWKSLIERSDIVFAAAHPDVNFAICDHAFKCGKPVIVEKPVAFNTEAVSRLLRRSKATKTPFIVNYIHLFDKDLLKLRDGKPHSMTVAMGGSVARDYSALWDYGSHAFAIVLDCIKKEMTAIEVLQHGEAYRLRFGTDMAEAYVGSNWPEKVAKVRGIGQDWELLWKDGNNDPLSALLNMAVGLHESGEYWTNGNLAVLVTALLEKIHKEIPATA